MSLEEFLEAARNGPECFKCQGPITEFDEVRVVTVRVGGKPRDVWVHADHASPDWVPQVIPEFCPGAADPRCRAACTILWTNDDQPKKILDPDCFRNLT